MESKNTQAAAIAAVMSYLKAEEEMMNMQAMALPGFERALAARAAPSLRVWGLSGRQTQMQMRSMLQMRTFK